MLAPGGCYVCVSRGSPETRMIYFQNKNLKWTIETIKIKKDKFCKVKMFLTEQILSHSCMFMFVLKVFEIIINMLKSKEEDLKAKVLEKMNVENLNEIVLIQKMQRSLSMKIVLPVLIHCSLNLVRSMSFIKFQEQVVMAQLLKSLSQLPIAKLLLKCASTIHQK